MVKTESEVLYDELLVINQEIDEKFDPETLKADLKNIKILHDTVFSKRRFDNIDFLKKYKSAVCSSIESSQLDCQTKLNQIELICRMLIQPKFARILRAYQKIGDRYKRKTDELLYSKYDWDSAIKDCHLLTASDKQRALISLYTLVPPRNSIDLSLLTLIQEGESMDPEFNYLVINKVGNPIKLHYLNHENSEIYETVSVAVGDHLRTFLRTYIRKNKIGFDMPLFADCQGRYYKPNDFSKLVLDTFSHVSCQPLTDKIIIDSYIDMILKLDLSNKLMFAIERQMSRKLR